MAEFAHESDDSITTAIIGRFYRSIQGGITTPPDLIKPAAIGLVTREFNAGIP